MRILEKGKKPTAEFRCPRCHSLLEVTEDDIVWYTEIDGGRAPAINCPVCGKGTDVEAYHLF